MNISIEQEGKVYIVTPDSSITSSDEEQQFRDKVYDLLDSKARNILVNMEHVNYMDSSGIGELVTLYTTTKNERGALKLLNPNERIMNLLELTQLKTVFEIFFNRADALNSFNQ